MELHSEKIEPDIVVIRPAGRLDFSNAHDLEAVVLRAIGAGELRIIVDLHLVEFLDSSGLGVLVACLKEARRAGGDVRVASAAEQPSMVLRLSNLDRLLGSAESVEAAYRV
ncbi:MULTISPECIES: STAS domain-containing protein [unclassified Rathayibacter]|uniref:STAS domain-containing protein n=1 Tax=unclassified Rathayibacter TaxID=2609250 RepID=UPI00188C5AC4|nr:MULTISPECIES: STAS domain-containing protein [unclassified Rathayibacter]MBF4462113.1 STAS domain-containing protein [Rathayibacter sp. VKM Ac-2879]MBF4503844.1 STAS domain-containing protein [Rathayibacter sp. VKM Ac-2878]